MDSLEKIIRLLNKVPVKPVSDVTFWGLLVLALGLSAQITWKLIPSADFQTNWQPSAMDANAKLSSKNVDLDVLHKLALFGKSELKITKPKQPVVEVVTEAPKTSLSIQLTGVVASTAEQNGLAIIASRGAQETYTVGSKISGTSAKLKNVFADRVILSNAGRYETLMLDGLKYTPGMPNNNSRPQEATQDIKTIDKRSDSEVAEKIADYREQLLQDPGKLTDVLSIAPVNKNGAVIGYRLRPGKDGRLFREAGFKANDVAKNINGYDLTDINQAIEIMG